MNDPTLLSLRMVPLPGDAERNVELVFEEPGEVELVECVLLRVAHNVGA